MKNKVSQGYFTRGSLRLFRIHTRHQSRKKKVRRCEDETVPRLKKRGKKRHRANFGGEKIRYHRDKIDFGVGPSSSLKLSRAKRILLPRSRGCPHSLKHVIFVSAPPDPAFKVAHLQTSARS